MFSKTNEMSRKTSSIYLAKVDKADTLSVLAIKVIAKTPSVWDPQMEPVNSKLRLRMSSLLFLNSAFVSRILIEVERSQNAVETRSKRTRSAVETQSNRRRNAVETQ